MRASLLVLVAALACSGSDVVTTQLSAPHAPARFVMGPLGTITPQSKPSLCATVNGPFADGTRVVLANCNGAATQKWAATSDGEYRANGQAYCLDTVNASSADGTAIFIWTCYSPASQHWTHPATGEVRRADGKCMDPTDHQVKVNKALVIYTCDGRTSQKWNAPNIPADTTPPPPPVCTGVTVNAGTSIQSAVNGNPASTTFCLKAGTYTQQTVVPKSGDRFLGEPGVVMDGQGVTAMAFYAWNNAAWVNDVTLKNIEIKNYNPPAQRGAVTFAADDTLNLAQRWILDSLNIHNNANAGIWGGAHAQILRTQSHHNGTLGVSAKGRGTLVDGSSFTFNNNGCPNNPGFESGGSKFVETDSLVVRNSTFSDNCGPGLWLDILNQHSDLYGNTVERNYREGIVIEVGLPGHHIHNNTVVGNGIPVDPYRGNGWGWDAGIGIHETPNVEVDANTVTDNFNGIVIVQQCRTVACGDPYAPPGGFIAHDVFVHDNVVTQRNNAGCDGAFAGGGVQDVGDTAIFTSRNNVWVHNTYFLGTNPAPFAWMNGCRTAAAWQGYGQDLTGTFNP